MFFTIHKQRRRHSANMFIYNNYYPNATDVTLTNTYSTHAGSIKLTSLFAATSKFTRRNVHGGLLSVLDSQDDNSNSFRRYGGAEKSGTCFILCVQIFAQSRFFICADRETGTTKNKQVILFAIVDIKHCLMMPFVTLDKHAYV